MSFFKLNNLKLSRRAIWFAASAFLAVWLGFVTPPDTQMTWFLKSGYFFLFGTFFLWIYSVWPKTNVQGAHVRTFFKTHGPAFALAFLLTAGMVSVSPPKLRILADETNLLSISLSMHEDRSVYVLTEGMFYIDQFMTTAKYGGKRPLFFPFLLSLIHAVKGYSVQNAFILNAAAGFLLLWTFYFLLSRWVSKTLALIGMVLLAAFPVLVLSITSGGFETVNLLFVLLAFLLLDRLLETGEPRIAERLGFTLVLLAQLRYESALFIPAMAPAIVWGLRRSSQPRITFPGILLPLLLLPVAWQRTSTLGSTFHQVPDDTVLFGAGHFFTHLSAAWRFFIGEESFYGTVPMLFYLSLAGSIYSIGLLIRRPLSRRTAGLAITAALMLLLQSLVIFSHVWGNLTLQLNMRLSLVFLPFLVFSTILLLSALENKHAQFKLLLGLGSAALLLYYWPVAARNEAGHLLLTQRNYHTALAFLKRHDAGQNTVMISDEPWLFTPHRWGAVSFTYANAHTDELLKHLRDHLIREIIVIQTIRFADHQPVPRTILHPGVRLETLYEAYSTPNEYLRFSRVVP